MKFERFIARRYLFSGQNKALVSLITIISIAGVALGVLALIVVTSVMDGFDRTLQNQLIGLNAHIEVARRDSNSPPITTGSLEQIRKLPGVAGAGPVIIRHAMVQVPGEGNEPRQTFVVVHGYDLEVEPHITSIMSHVKGNNKPGPDDIVLGARAAVDPLMVKPGDEVRLVVPQFVATRAMGNIPLTRMATISGVMSTGFPEFDQTMAYVSLEGAQNLFLAPEGQVDGLRIMCKDPNQMASVAREVQKLLGDTVLVTTVLERNKQLLMVLVLEKWSMFIILLLIVLVAAFNIIGTLTMVVTDKTREIGILKSMGAPESSILRIFRNQGLFIGGMGTALGAVLGLFICYLLRYHIHIPELREAYMSDHVPVYVTPWMVVLIVVCSMLICLLASLYPARTAARLDPVEALRYE